MVENIQIFGAIVATLASFGWVIYYVFKKNKEDKKD